MKLLVFSDIHSDHKALEKLIDTEADHYFAAGDLVSWSRGLDRVGQILQRRAGRLHVIPGNHESPAEIAAFCAQWGLNDLHGKSMQLGRWHVAGLGCSNRTPFDTPGEYTEEEFARRLTPFALLDPLVMVCHCPPKDSLLDRAGPTKHFGSPAVRAFLEHARPRYFFCGHIHEAEGASERFEFGTLGVNVGKRGYLLDLDKLESE